MELELEVVVTANCDQFLHPGFSQKSLWSEAIFEPQT